MKCNKYAKGSNAMAVDVFMGYPGRCNWSIVREFFPDDYKEPCMDTIRVDESWIGRRSKTNLSYREKVAFKNLDRIISEKVLNVDNYF